MPRLLSECPAAWKLIAVGVVPNYSLSALWTGRCRLWEARVVQPLLLWVTGAHVRSHFVQMQKKCTKGLEMKFHAVPGSYIPLIPSISWSLSTLMRLWKGLYQEVKKRVLVPLELRDQMVEALPVSWVQRNCFFSSREGSQSNSAKWSPPENYKRWVAFANQMFVSAAGEPSRPLLLLSYSDQQKWGL